VTDYIPHMTRGDEFIQAMRTAVERLRALTFGPYAREDIANIIDPLGSRLESFLRAVAYPGSTRQDKFYHLIEKLRGSGLPGVEVQRLHDLRELYNTSKHDPAIPLVLANAIAKCEYAAAALRAGILLGPGTVNVPFERELNYTLYVGFWDHYTGGETEVAIFVPSDHWTHVAAADVFSMDFRAWDALKPVLLAHPRFRMGKAHFAPEVWKGFCDEGEFLGAGVWEGDYGELVRILADHEGRDKANAVLPFLARHNNRISYGTALVIAAVDVARAASAALDAGPLAQSIMARAEAEYAMPSSPAHVPKAAVQIAALIAPLPFSHWGYLAGPALTPYKGREWPKEPEGPLAVALDGNVIILGC
jgi:hypothetical protein